MDNTKMMLLIDSHHGIYIPYLFCKNYAVGNYKFTLNERVMDSVNYIANDENAESEFYWDSWDDVLSMAIITFEDSDELTGKYFLSQHDSDLWIVHESIEYDDFGFPIND